MISPSPVRGTVRTIYPVVAGFFIAVLILAGIVGCGGQTTSTAPTTGITTTPPDTTPPGTTGTPSPTPTTPAATGGPSYLNGRQIYLYAENLLGDPIYSSGTGMMMGGFSCAYCHGTDGRGGRVFFMMREYDVPDITWPELTGHHEDHEPYTAATVKRAIVDGVDPAGNPLEYPMPRWSMSEADLDDLLAYLMTLS